MPTIQDLKTLQNLPYELKLLKTQQRIREWYNYWQGNVYVSVSGKDSTVVLDIVRKLYPDVVGVFVDTGLEYPEVKECAKSHENMIFLHTEKPFWQVVRDYGYPIISKEVSECVANARAYVQSGGGYYKQHYRKLNGLGEYTTKNKETVGNTDKKGCP